jgi:glutathione S-transferase
MKLYVATGACGLHVQIAAREAGVPFELVLVDLATKRTADSRDYNEITPKSYIPALQFDDGSVLTEGAVIAQWLADRAPNSGLLPPYGSLDRYRVLEWLHYIGTEIHKSYTPLFKPSSDSEKAEAREYLTKRLTIVEERLARAEHLVGERFTLADGYLFNVLTWAKPAGLDLSPFPALKAWTSRTAQRLSVRESMVAEGLITRAKAA